MAFRLQAWTLAFSLLASPCAAGDEVAARFAKVRGKTFSERVDSAGRMFLGVPYMDAPLGEGKWDVYDKTPPYRFDGFDCTTFVETVLALAMSEKAEEFEKNLLRIRYHGDRPSFVTRNHFPCVDWSTHNIRTGLLSDLTEALGKRWGIQYATAPVTKKGWFEKLSPEVIRVPGISDAERQKLIAALRQQGRKFDARIPRVPYVPLDKILTRSEVPVEEKARRAREEKELEQFKYGEAAAMPTPPEDVDKYVHDEIIDLRLKYLIKDVQVDSEFLSSIPTGSILNIVRPGWSIPGTKMNISHQGFVIQKKEGTYFRHVSRTSGRAKDVPLANYLRLSLLIPAIKGVNILGLAGHYLAHHGNGRPSRHQPR